MNTILITNPVMNPGCFRYSKIEDLEPGGEQMMSYTHLLVGVTGSQTEIQVYNNTHKLLDTVNSFSGIRFKQDGSLPFVLSMAPKICILKNKSMPRWPPSQTN